MRPWWFNLLILVVLARDNVHLTIPNVTAINDVLNQSATCSIPKIVPGDIPMLQGSFGNNLVGNGPITLPIMLAAPDPDGCPPGHLNFTCPGGCIVLVRRGSCSFVEKTLYANGTGVSAVIIYDNVDSGDPLVPMGGDDERIFRTPGMPAYFMGFSGGDPLAAALNIGLPVFGTMQTTGAIDQLEWEALREIADNLTLGICDGEEPLFCERCNITNCGFGDARPWNELAENVDPCLFRVAGTRCVDGHVVEIDFPYPLVGALFPALGRLPFLETLILERGLISDAGCVLQNLTRLKYVDLSDNMLTTYEGCNAIPSIETLNLQNNELESLPGSIMGATGLRNLFLGGNSLTELPPEIGNLSKLEILYCYRNNLTALPSEIGNLPNISIILASVNALTSIPTSILALDSLRELYVSSNPLTTLPFTKILPNLTVVWAEANNFTTFPPLLANMTTLEELRIGENLISGLAPTFHNFPRLTTLGLNNNNFTGPVPTLDNSSRLINLYLFNNEFSGPLPQSWSRLLSLQELRLQFNLITPPIHVMRGMPKLRTVDLSHNNLALPSLIPLAGPNDAGALIFASVPTSIHSINMAFNHIAGDMDSLWSGPLRDLAIINVSHNQITSSLGLTATEKLNILDISYNKLEYVDEDLPASGELRLISYKGNPGLKMQSSELPYWLSPQEPTVLYSDTSLLCQSVGLSPAVTSTSSQSFQINFDPEFFSNAFCECIPGTYGEPPQCDLIPSFFRVNSTNETIMDSDFGIHRQIAGVDIIFGSPIVSSRPRVRVTELTLKLGPDFGEFTDLVEVYAGDANLKGPRIISIRGTDSDVHSLDAFTYATLTKLPSANISGVLWPSMRLHVWADEVVIRFQSRSERGRHISAVFAQSHECPTGFAMYDVDPILTCKPVVLPYETSSVSKAILYLVVAVGAMAISVTLGLFAKFSKTRVVRATSPLFSGLTLGSLLIFLFGSLLYAATPDDGVCNARVWLTFAPLVAILSFFVSKVNRVRNIFSSTKLKSSSRHLRATRLLQLCAVLVGIMVILLIIYSGVPLTTSAAEETTDRVGGVLTISLEHKCVGNNDTLFLVWCTATGLYIFGILVWAIYNAYAIRNTPSAFNESTHILQCLIGLFTLITLCGLFLLVLPNSPDLVLIVWGLGQALAAMFIYTTLFGPKLFALARSGKKPTDTNVAGTGVRSISNLSATGSHIKSGSETGSYSRDPADGPPKTELELMADRLDNAEKALKAQRAQFEHMFREWGWTGELN